MVQEQNRPLVTGPDGSENIPEQLLGCVEPVFPASVTGDLRFPRTHQPLLADYFCHRIARDPQDLRSHVRRIFLTCESGLAEEIFPALIDLFIALGKNGTNLRRRMLEFSRAHLGGPEYNLLRDALATGLNAATLPFTPGSVLCQGIEGTLQCVRPAAEAVGTSRDPLVEAREFLEYSQLDEARGVLEQAVLHQPQRADLHRELLSVYRSTRDKTNFSKTLRALDGAANPVPEAWRDLEEYFGSLDD